jgi:hypothetical protein
VGLDTTDHRNVRRSRLGSELVEPSKVIVSPTVTGFGATAMAVGAWLPVELEPDPELDALPQAELPRPPSSTPEQPPPPPPQAAKAMLRAHRTARPPLLIALIMDLSVVDRSEHPTPSPIGSSREFLNLGSMGTSEK